MSESSKVEENRVVCPACSEKILEQARKCKHCGEVLDNRQSNEGSRKVGILLGAGIFFMPYIFGWFTLRKGHSTAAKVVAFGWMFFAFALIGSDASKTTKHQPSGVAISNGPKLKLENKVKKAKPSYWLVGNYVDEFGDKTKESFVSNRKPVIGTFSNSATTNSPLKVDFLIDSPKKINFKLYEYARNSPVKAFRRTKYNVYVKGGDGKKHSLTAFNSSDRLVLGPKSSGKLYNLLVEGENVSFVVAEAGNNITSYRFAISGRGFSEVVSERKMASQ